MNILHIDKGLPLYIVIFLSTIITHLSFSQIIQPNVSAEKNIFAFSFSEGNNEELTTNFVGIIDETNKTITIPNFPSGTDVSSLIPNFESSDKGNLYFGSNIANGTFLGGGLGINYNMVGETSMDLNDPNNLKIISEAENHSFVIYKIIFPGKSITSFSFEGIVPNVTATINETTHSITAVVHSSTDVTTLVASFISSTNSTVTISGAVQTSGTTPNDFTNPVIYTVTALDNSVQNYLVTVTKAAARTEKSILSFAFNGISPIVTGTINEFSLTINVIVHFSTDLTNLVATFTNSVLSRVTVSGVNQISATTANDFSNPVTYRVIAENGTNQDYLVTVIKAAARDSKELLTFRFNGLEIPAIGTFNGFNVNVNVPFSTDVTTLPAVFTHSPLSTVAVGGVAQISGTTVNDFTGIVTYTVTAENSSTRNYYITVTKSNARADKALLSFKFLGLDPPVTGTINQVNHTVSLTVPFSTNITALIPTFANSVLSKVKVGGVVQLSGTTAQNFTNPVVYTVEAENLSTQNYTVTVTKSLASSEKRILSYSFLGINPAVTGVINETANTINLSVPFATDVTALVATFAKSSISAVSVGGVLQVSGTTANNFTGPVNYLVTAEDGSTRYYTVTVTKVGANTGNSLLTFVFNALTPIVTGVINETTKVVTCSVMFGANITSLVATFTHSPYSTVTVGGVLQVSGITGNDFTNPVQYTVTAQDGSAEIYNVVVSRLAASQENSLLSFSFQGLNPPVTGTIDESIHTVSIAVPFLTDLTTLVATYTSSPLSAVAIGGVLQVNGTTANDFTNPVNYSVIAEDGSMEIYTVTVTKAAISDENSIESFIFNATTPVAVGVIEQGPGLITLVIDITNDITALVATFVKSSGSVVTVGGVVQISGISVNDFSNPLIYLVTAEDASTKTYNVTVTKEDLIPPVVSNEAQTITNAIGSFALVQSNEASGLVYILRDGEPAAQPADFIAAVANNTAVGALVTAANTDIPLGAVGLKYGNYYAYAIDVAGNISAKGINIIQVADLLPPVVTAAEQSVSNAAGQYFEASSNEDNGKIYIILDGEPQASVANFESAILTNKCISVIVTKADSLYKLLTQSLSAGTYYAYAVDFAGNISVKGTNPLIVHISSNAKAITVFRFAGLDPVIQGVIGGTDIMLAVAQGTDVTALVATFVHSALSVVTVNDVVQVSGQTANDFTYPVPYKVTAEDGSYVYYTVSVAIGNSINDISNGSLIKIFPNPASGILNLGNLIPVKKIELTNSLGQLVFSTDNNGDNTLEINTEPFDDGIYIIMFYNNKGLIRTQKVIFR